jgi:hypothetical protein
MNPRGLLTRTMSPMAVLAALAAAGCGDDGSGGAGNGGDKIALLLPREQDRAR